MAHPKSHEILIAGGGLVGNALAIACAQAGIDVAVVDPLPREKQLDDAFDGRTSAIALASTRILQQLGAWQHVAPHAQPIHDIRVCDQDKPGYVHYSDTDVGEPFGYIVENAKLRRGLFLALEATQGITQIPGKVVDYMADAHASIATLEDGSSVRAPLLVAADGRFSKLRDIAGLKSRKIAYGQTAMVCVIEHSLPHHGLALEKFYPAGPFAALPLKPLDGVNRSGIVWTESEEDAPQYLALPESEFDAELQKRIGAPEVSAWGSIKTVGKKFSYPLVLMHADDFIANRFALVGDAAHGIHPIAGQGVNLGYRDVAVLAQLLAEQKALGLDLGAHTLLARYQRWRKFDSVSMTASTDLLNRLFSNDLPGLSLVRRAGLSAVERMPRLKQLFMRHAMGLIGDLPKMMEPPRAA
ncbi:MAG: 2-octaprenyl-6-methoxyphenyl hydroxylase [Azospirillum brasilense]|nr:MAG: 2-octaprenyl-6-methoxyphenyl hydroxylase [Azospirillum brasilense]